MTMSAVVDDKKLGAMAGQFNRVEEDALEQLPFKDDEVLIYAGEELPEDVVAEQTDAEIKLFEMGSRAAVFGTVARHVSGLIEQGVHEPKGSTSRVDAVFVIGGPA